MAIVKKKIELSERDIIEIVSEKYGLNPSKTSVSIVGSDHSSHDPRERSAENLVNLTKILRED